MKDENDDFDICVLLADGKIVVINQRDNEDPDSEDFSIDTSIDFQCDGNLLKFSQDRDDN